MGGRFILRIARDGNMSSVIAEEKTNSSGATVKISKPGKYYWNISLLSDDGKEIISKSKVLSFQVALRLSAPRPIFPAQGQVVDMAYRNSLDFRWRAAAGAGKYEVKLMQVVGARKKLIMERVTAKRALSFNRLEKLDKGRFTWSVRAIGTEAGKTVKSKEIINRFRITLSNEPIVKIDPAEVYK